MGRWALWLLFGMAPAALALTGCGASASPEASAPRLSKRAQAARASGRSDVRPLAGARIDCGGFCDQLAQACYDSCEPNAYSPDNYGIQTACDADCRSRRFQCESECAVSYAR